MFKNYIITAIRNLMRNKLHTFINISGLSIGITVSILILSYVWFELSFDRFHSKADQVYRIIVSRRFSEIETHYGKTGHGLAPVLEKEFPEIIQSARLGFWEVEIELALAYDNKEFIETPAAIACADPELFEIFDIIMTLGDPETALKDPDSIILTEEESFKIFGNEYPLGKFINICDKGEEADEGLNLKVTGIVKALPANSHFSFKYLVPYEKIYPSKWYNTLSSIGGYTYITLPPDYPPQNLESKLPGIVEKYIAPEIAKNRSISYDDFLKSGGYYRLGLQPLKAIHLDNIYLHGNTIGLKKGNRFHVRIYAVIALFIIALACINFVTLSTARSWNRAKEVGVRKVNGAARKQLIRQFLIESVLHSSVAMVFAALLVLVFSRPFNRLLDIQTSLNLAGILFVLVSLFIITLIVGAIAGSYPAFLLSAFKPVNVLRGQLWDRMKGMAIRNSLVIFQFMISIVLIISSITVYKQFTYLQNKDLGYDKENIIIIENLYRKLRSEDLKTREDREIRFATFRQEVLKNPNVASASFAEHMPFNSKPVSLKYVRTEGEPNGTYFSPMGTYIDHAYIDVFGLEMAEGKNFRSEITIPQALEGVIINKEAEILLGLKDPVGKYIYSNEWTLITNNEGNNEWVRKEVKIPVIGVFKDFNNRNLRAGNRAVIYFPLFKNSYGASNLAVRFLPGNINEKIASLEKTWEKFAGERSFEYSVFETEYLPQYKEEKKMAQVFLFFTILAIFISCLGIFGLATITAEQRTKEIGIRKANGARIWDIVYRINRNFLTLVAVAFVIAAPVGWYAMHRWLENFAYHTALSWWIFVLAGALALFIALLTVSGLSWRAATRNPVEALRYE